ncbi:beta-galactosidase [Hyphomonas sp.]|uniref:beta-galactosidase n=1 Tax=Hyphomonas sp. TaxID=87 RepID=UPI0032EAA36A|tara:strand:- start:5227 stop:7197 length:1971 start_codon:yes stop_codon:yes gene_type:complete
MTSLGVCYYPEHWPEKDWADDARRMKRLGLDRVRIGEFAWSRMEPAPGQFDWAWLDRAIEVLHGEGLGIILCTPTATPPKWLVDRHPDILPCDKHGHPKKFGSRRHYCFSSGTYRRESARIVTALASRYGDHPAVIMWQTDNEYGHHGTHESFSPDAARAFRVWLEDRYKTISALNAAWGTAFWSQTYRSFDEIDPPNATVTEANPSHRLDYRRFSSDEICAYNQMQVDILRELSPGRPIAHNYIGDFTLFDHHDVSAALDYATWDSYPIGLLSEGDHSNADKARWLRNGHPDFAAFNHDVVRHCSPKWGVMEQQPGPVNWATHNCAPAQGMVRLWTWEAFAHGADFVSYFRWRQAPFGQEQTHAGLLMPDRRDTPVIAEIRQVKDEMERIGAQDRVRAPVAILHDYPSLWQHEIQPQGRAGSVLEMSRAIYSACRRLGLDVDVVPPRSDLEGYRLILLPSLTIMNEDLVRRLTESGATVLATSLTGSRTGEGHIPDGLAPGTFAELIPMRVDRFESIAPFIQLDVEVEGKVYDARLWRESVTSPADVRAHFPDGEPAWLQHKRCHYLACWPGDDLLDHVLRRLCEDARLSICDLGPGLRLRRAGNVQFAFNYGPEACDLRSICAPADEGAFLIGGAQIPCAGVSAWRLPLNRLEP